MQGTWASEKYQYLTVQPSCLLEAHSRQVAGPLSALVIDGYSIQGLSRWCAVSFFFPDGTP